MPIGELHMVIIRQRHLELVSQEFNEDLGEKRGERSATGDEEENRR